MTTTLDIILYHAKRYFDAEAKAMHHPTDKNVKAFEKRKYELTRAVSRLSIKQGKLFS